MLEIRNIAIIAHVDHGKTTLVDKIIDQAKILDDRKERTDLLLDNNDLERERGITILSKNVSVNYKDVKINVINMNVRYFFISYFNISGTKTSFINAFLSPLYVLVIGFPFLVNPSKTPLSTRSQSAYLA